ncbi:hypothetical protein [Clostridium aminobutyricum]|uniref:Uncharacterized protein n=1 Tax=Clostridium aminobutyricum TaxID=33953 RepID=A0A939DAN3_CLOAM|nr:hypothetical protein [Clostridium aminobutyricum]MBN7774225.1 hypothetical protein [Clostridium aminobutyricum]
MNIKWFKDPDNVVYADVNQFAENFSKETGIDNLREKLEEFKKNPVKEGKILTGKKRTSIKLMVPNLTFGQPIEMGETVWVYLGENYESYCLYWPQ